MNKNIKSSNITVNVGSAVLVYLKMKNFGLKSEISSCMKIVTNSN
jgi:hypothetical protein